MTQPRVLILPGRGNSGPDHWQTHWQAAHPEFIRVHQQDWDTPARTQWVATLHAAITASPVPAVLVAHSLAVGLVAHWARRHTGPVVGALLVAPSDVEASDYPPGPTGFAPIALSSLPFRSIVVASTDDPRVSVARATEFSVAWGARLEIAGALAHIGSDSKLGDWPQGYRWLQELLSGAQSQARRA